MADHTKIEWTDATWNPITGCAVVSPGCTNCYAMKLAGTRLKHHPSRKGLTTPSKAGPVWNGKISFNTQWLDQPLRWKKPRMIFVCAHGDLFAEGVTDAMIDQVFAVMALAPQHIFQVLTKRPERMRDYMADWVVLPNVWLGVSAEDQTRANERVPHLLLTPAAVRFVSAEPLLGPIDFTAILTTDEDAEIRWNTLSAEAWVENSDSAAGYSNASDGVTALDWIIVGGESGKAARPMHPDWVRSIRDDCFQGSVPFFFKQWGEWAPQVGAVDGWNIADDPEISRFEHREWEDGAWGRPFRPAWCDWDNLDETQVVSRIGKKQAGRLLDGIEHSAQPATMPTGKANA